MFRFEGVKIIVYPFAGGNAREIIATTTKVYANTNTRQASK